MKIYGALLAALITVPTMAAAQDTSGPRLEVRVGYETPTVTEDNNSDVYKLGSAVSYGGEAGFDLKIGEKLRFGPYANYELASVESCGPNFCAKVKGTFSAGGRIGYAPSDKGVVYVKLGYADMKIRLTDTPSGVSETFGHGGIQGALGYEGNIGTKMYWKIEGVYSDNGELFEIPTVHLQRRQLVGGFGVRF